MCRPPLDGQSSDHRHLRRLPTSWPQHGCLGSLSQYTLRSCSCSVVPTTLETEPKPPPHPAAQARPDPACSGQRCAPLSRPPHPTRDTHGLQSLQGGGCAGGWSPPWPALSARGPGTGGWAFLSPHGPRTGVPRTHLGAFGTRSLPPPCLEGRPGLRAGQGLPSGLQVALWWGLPAARPGHFSCSGLGLGPGHHVHSPSQLFIH